MKVIVIGGVAAGTKAAAKLRRENHSADVTIYTRGREISYAGCGLPYYVGGSIESSEALIVNTPEKFAGLTGVRVVTGTEAIAVNAAEQTVQLRSMDTGDIFTEDYDELILAVGAEPIVPDIPGKDLPGVFTMRTPEDAVALRAYVEAHKCRSAVVIGCGFIGLEVAENLQHKGLSVTVADAAAQLLPNVLDTEAADYVRRQLQQKGLRIRTGTTLRAIAGTEKVIGADTTAGLLPADVVVLALGIRPATGFLADSGLEMEKGAIVADSHQRTSLPHVYAVGDCAMVFNRLTGQRQWSAMGSTANLTGRCLAKNLTGTDAPYMGCLGTGVIRLGEKLNAGRTGLTEQQALDAGFDAETVMCVIDDKANYYADAASFVIKLIADRVSHKVLGMQVVGAGAVDKLVDVAVTGIALGAALEDFDTLDLAYAPPFSTAIHPFAKACHLLENKLSGAFETFTPAEYAAGKAKGYRVIDVHPVPTIPGAPWVDLSKVVDGIEGARKEDKLLLVCARGRRGYLLQNRLKALGYVNTRVAEGGMTLNAIRVERAGTTLTPEEIKRVKGLGCLQDKRYPDVFNVRVITRNGKITVQEHRDIAEAAERFGSGAVAMTTRLTLEIQGVKYDNIQPLIDFLKERGLDCGGTGSLVRPVVSCKGTTCQYGLIDTYALSEEIHNRFYLGYRGVTLPHKFKIAVGGCPNNCVKPNLNDLGIIGQRVPVVDAARCRGCKKCQVEAACPIKIARVQEGVIRIDPNECNNCGRCENKCPFGAIDEYITGYRVYIGGRWGKRVAQGVPLNHLFTSDEEVLDVIERTILLFRDEGIPGERLSDTVARLGFDYVEDKLLHQQIDKDAILNKNVKGGATC